jgi:hypothetical protein
LVEYCGLEHPGRNPFGDQLVLIQLKYYRKMNPGDARPHRSLLGSQTEAYAGNSSNRHSTKFDCRSNLETVEVALKEADELVACPEEPPGPEDQDGAYNQNQACEDE